MSLLKIALKRSEWRLEVEFEPRRSWYTLLSRLSTGSKRTFYVKAFLAMAAVLVASVRLQRKAHVYSTFPVSASSCLVSSTYPPSIPPARVADIFRLSDFNVYLQQHDTVTAPKWSTSLFTAVR